MSAARKAPDRFSGDAGKSTRFLRRKNLVRRKAATTASSAARRPFPAWIAADEGGIAFSAAAVTPRVRSALVLRMVGKGKSLKPKRSSDGHGAR